MHALLLIIIAYSLQLAAYCSFAGAAVPQPSSGELTTKSWIAHGKKDIERCRH